MAHEWSLRAEPGGYYSLPLHLTIVSRFILQAYRRKAKEIGFDEYHAFLRAVSFDFAQTKPEAEIQNVLFTIVTEDDSRVDR